jgi:predicted AlkP superfamily pyrophosphatase or phosphodiesterase
MAVGFPAAVCAGEPAPRLVLQITVDQLRGDFITRYEGRLGEGGFRYLLDNGVYYSNAHYQHANTETIVGHASLATGTVPAAHGMVGNVWFDQELGRQVYNIEDPDYRLLSANADVDASIEIDPTQKAAKVDGRSPNAILSSTFGDELALSYGGQSRVFGVSIKDRGAVAMAGHAGKAFWFSKATGEFVTSNYYYERYPDWVIDFNQRKHSARFAGQSWSLLHDQDSYRFGDSDDRPWETDFPGWGRTFPHAYGNADDKYFTTRLTLGPAGDQLVLEFTRALVKAENVGHDSTPDYLSVSFSSTDYVGHLFGASSLEAEDHFLQLDRTLAELLSFIDTTVGLDHTLIVLSADHGGPDTPGYLNEIGLKKAHYFDTESLDRQPAITALKERFDIGEELITGYFHPYIYLDRELIAKRGLEQAEVEAAVAAELQKFTGIRRAVSTSALAANRLPDTLLMRSILNNYHHKRSGDIYVVFEPSVFINDFDGLIVAATHGSPWRYDTHVPIIFSSPGIEPARFSRPVTPYDIAATLAARLGTKPPSAAIGEPLPEIMSN